MTARHPSNPRKLALSLLRLGFLAVIFYLIFRNISLEEAKLLLTPALGIAFAIGVVLTLCQALTCTLRWSRLAAHVPQLPRVLDSFMIYMEGLFFNQALPSFVGGDAVRVMRWKRRGVGLHDASVSVVRDRLFGAIGASLLALVAAILLLNYRIPKLTLAGVMLLSLSALLAGIGLLAIIQSRRISRLLARFPRVHAQLARISDRKLSRDAILVSTVYSIAGQLICGGIVLVLARSMGIELPAWLLVSIAGIVLLVTMIPISFAGWGIREASFITLLAPLGVSGEKALLLGVMFGLVSLAASFFGGYFIVHRAFFTKSPD